MTQEQQEHVEKMLICMIEKAHSQFMERLVGDNSPLLGAAAEAVRALIALDESTPEIFPKVRVFQNINGKSLDETPPVRGINVALPDKEELTCDDAWELVEKAIWSSDDRTHAQEEFDKLPPLVRKAVGRPEQLYDWNLVFRRGTLRDEVESNFREAFRSVTEPENRHGGQERRIVVKGVVHIDTTELDAALAKAERLEEILRRIRVGGGTE